MTVADRAALADLVHRYAGAVDDRRFDDAVNLFVTDAELVVPDPPGCLTPVTHHVGHRAIRDAVRAVAAVDRTEHAIVGEVYDDAPGPGTARGRVACADVKASPGRVGAPLGETALVTLGEVAEWQTQPPQKRPRQLMWVRLPPSLPRFERATRAVPFRLAPRAARAGRLYPWR